MSSRQYHLVHPFGEKSKPFFDFTLKCHVEKRLIKCKHVGFFVEEIDVMSSSELSDEISDDISDGVYSESIVLSGVPIKELSLSSSIKVFEGVDVNFVSSTKTDESGN